MEGFTFDQTPNLAGRLHLLRLWAFIAILQWRPKLNKGNYGENDGEAEDFWKIHENSKIVEIVDGIFRGIQVNLLECYVILWE